MYSQMNCLIENEYIMLTLEGTFFPHLCIPKWIAWLKTITQRELSKKKIAYVFPNELPNWKRLHKGNFPKKNSYVFPNELPNWKRLHKGNFPKKQITHVFPNELPNWKRLHKGNFQKKKNTYVFPNELPNWKRILKGKNGKTREKKLAYFITGGFYYCEPGVGVLYCGGGY